MSLINELVAWLRENPPEQMPYWPGAKVTTPFGLRPQIPDGTSPLHLGVDRAGGRAFLMPFDGCVFWRAVGGVAGSVLSLIPHGMEMEIQVFHTEADAGVEKISTRLTRGELLPVEPGDIGVSYGVHTHTEVLFPYDTELVKWLHAAAAQIVNRGAIDIDYLIRHCRSNNLNAAKVRAATTQQIDEWGISEMTTRYAVRDSVPEYRRPEWGRGATVHVDSRWLLQI